MSDRAGDRPADWRPRRPRSHRGTDSGPVGAGGGGQDSAEPPEMPGEEQDAELSRTLFSFLESGLDAIGSFGAPIIISGIVGLVSGISIVAFAGYMRPYGIAAIIIGLALIGMVGLISVSSVLAAFFSRTGRYGVNTAIMLAAFTGIVMVANFISFEKHSRIDITATNQFSLADRTRQLLEELPVDKRVSTSVMSRNGYPSCIAR